MAHFTVDGLCSIVLAMAAARPSTPCPAMYHQGFSFTKAPYSLVMVLWYFPEYKIAVISTSYADMSVSQNVEKSVTQCARPLRFPWTSPM